MPVGRAQSYGVWETSRFVGVVLYGRGASPYLAPSLGLDRFEVCELTRVALRDHDHAVSQIVARTLALLRRSSPRLRVVVSFADPYHGHHGGIYQALNWLYLGLTEPAIAYRDGTGRLHHQRVVTASGIVRQFGKVTRVPRPDDLERVVLPGKHRYALPLDRALRRRLVADSLPYPPAVEVSEGTRLVTGEESQVRSLATAPPDRSH